jgi:hypothetical protein
LINVIQRNSTLFHRRLTANGDRLNKFHQASPLTEMGREWGKTQNRDTNCACREGLRARKAA